MTTARDFALALLIVGAVLVIGGYEPANDLGAGSGLRPSHPSPTEIERI